MESTGAAASGAAEGDGKPGCMRKEAGSESSVRIE